MWHDQVKQCLSFEAFKPVRGQGLCALRFTLTPFVDQTGFIGSER